MRPPRPAKPAGIDTPGLSWRPRKNHWVGYWTCRQDIAGRGYPIKTRLIWPPSEADPRTEPTADDWAVIAERCQVLQDEMLAWSNGGGALNDNPLAMFDDTLASLVAIYLHDRDSPFQELRYHTKLSYESKLKTLGEAVGQARISALTFRDFKRWHERFRRAVSEGKVERIARAHGLMTMLRLVIAFAAKLNLPNCRNLKFILDEMEFQLPKRRVDHVTAAQSALVRQEAHRRGLHSIALAQAIQFELMLRQKDVIGEWLPLEEPGLSDVIDRAQKWMNGLRWDEIDANLLLTHRISKSLRGRRAAALPDAGKVEAFQLTSYPMIMEELAFIPVARRQGPVIVAEHTGLPWRQKVFAEKWREIARAAGVPDKVQNRDSRAGGITEATDSTSDFEAVRRHAGHSQPSMTARYSRSTVEIKNKVARLRVEGREKK